MLAGTGCATSSAPEDFLPTAPEVLTDPYGAWVDVSVSDAFPTGRVAGELLAVDEERIHVLPLLATQVRSIPRDEVRRVDLVWFDSRWGRHSLWTLLGSLSTASHGVLLVGSLPLWTLSGIGITAERSRDPVVTYPDSPWSDLRKYARYPQGMPVGAETLLRRY